MKRQRQKTVRRGILVIIIIGILMGGVYLYLDNIKKKEAPAGRDAVEEKKSLQVEEEPQQIAEAGLEKTDEPVTEEKKDPCLEMESQVREFFLVLDKQAYIKQMRPEEETSRAFMRIIGKLSKDPPHPAGDSLDPWMMIKNIFYFFRVLDGTELNLIKEIIKHEEETLEMNLDIFYKWLMLGDQCSDPGEIRPSFLVAYSFSGFFINTIGGRAYLFRRTPGLRQLVIYYALLTIHEADKRGKNVYGIDVFPEIRTLAKEMGSNPDLIFQQEYLGQLNNMLMYYQDRR